LDGTGPLSGLGIACWIVGLAMLLSIILTPNGWGWWMNFQSVKGREIGGLVYYSVNGMKFSVDDLGAPPGSPPHPRTVYYLRSDPSTGSLHVAANEAVDWGSTAGPGLSGAILISAGFARRARHRELARSRDSHDSFGQGIPSGTVRALLDRNARPS
jgi:hypothetical protein